MARKFKTPITIDELGSASSQALAANVDGDSQNRINIDAGGKITWGSGSATGDTTLYRSAADTLKTDDAFTATSLAVTGQFTFPTSDGSADQVITTNGSGTLTWSDISANATVSDTAPSSPATGQIWYESDTGKTFVYYDSFWIEVGASPPASPFITDLDEDTKIQVEESSDEDKIRFDTAGSERMIIDASGNVGIGTTSPSTALEVSSNTGGGTTSTDLRISSTGQSSTWSTSNAWGVLDFYNADGSGGGAKSHASLRVISNDVLGQDSDLQFHVTDHSATDITAMTIQGGTGNLGIGTTSPAEELHILKDQDGDLTQVLIENLDQRVRIGSYYEAGVAQYGKIQSEQDNGNNVALVLNPEGGNVGIGTTSPGYKLDVEDATAAILSLNDSGGTVGAATNSRVIFEAGGSMAGSVGFLNTGSGVISLKNEDGPIYLTTGSSDGIMFRPNATEAMRITSSGDVGIGTTSPGANLQVVSQNRAFSVLDTGVNNNAEAGFTTLGGDGPAFGAISGYDVDIKTGTSRAGLASRLHVHRDGNVGIGTTSPDTDLHIQTASNTMAHFESTDAEALIAFSDNSSTGNWYDRRLGVVGEQMVFITNNTRRMTISDLGRVGINNSNPDSQNGSEYQLDVLASSGGCINMDHATTTTTAGLIKGYSNVGATNTLQFIIRADGDFESRTNSYGATSDAAIKQDIVDAPSQWDDIKAVQLRKYRLIDDVATNGDDALVQLGVVAQELEAAGLGGLVVDAAPDDDKPHKSVKYSVLLLKALGALQEAMTRIEALEAG